MDNDAKSQDVGTVLIEWDDEVSPTPLYGMGDHLEKRGGAAWRGKVVGFYSTALTPRGYCIESELHPGSVQIYPEAALQPA